MPTREPWATERARAIVADHAHLQGATLPILHALQHAFGYVDREAVALIADALNLSRAEVFGTISFYHDFRSEPPGRHVLKVCRAEACQALGGEALQRHCKAALGVEWHGTTADGAITLEPVFCLGLCAIAPAALMDDAPLARLDGAKVDAMIAEMRA